MKILIVSDTHSRDTNLEEVLEKEKPIDGLIHLGDVEGSEHYIRELAECPVHMVSGNNDFFCDLPREEEFTLGNYRVLITHGHYYYVSLDMQELKRQAEVRDIDLVMFGHTHRPLVEREGKTLFVNPGSLSYPRQEGRKPSYIVMRIDEKGDAEFVVNYLKHR